MIIGKTITLTIWTFVGKVISLPLARFAIAFLPRNKLPLISWLQSPSAVILELKKIKRVTVKKKKTLIKIMMTISIFINNSIDDFVSYTI